MMAGLSVAVVCIGVIATIGIFLPSQTIQQPASENKAWQFKQDFSGIGSENMWVKIESEIWRISWYAFALENFENYSYFILSVTAFPDTAEVMGTKMIGEFYTSGAEYIIQNGWFFIDVKAVALESWSLYIYEYH